MEITFETKAWLSKHNYVTPDEILTPKGAASLHYTIQDMTSFGDAFIGKATVTVEIPDMRTMVDNKIAALKEEAKTIRAEATAKCTAIESQIQQLLCIENNPSAADPA